MQDPSVLNRQPKKDDPQEISIRKHLQGILESTLWAKSTINELRDKQITFFQFAEDNLDKPEAIRQKEIELVKDLAFTGKSKIIEGEENLSKIEPGQSVIIVTNHLGTAKLTAFSPKEIGLDVPIDTVEPFPIRHAPLSVLSDKLEAPLFEAAVELPNPLNEVQKAAGVIAIPASGSGRLTALEDDTKKALTNQKGLVVMYPEGGTSGKRNDGGPYDLDHFQTGAFVIAAHLSLPILPVCQYFNPEGGFEIAILPPIEVENTEDKEYFSSVAQKVQAEMQFWLDSRK